MKKCPFCSEEIQDTAIKCRFCKKFLNNEEAEITNDGISNSKNNALDDLRKELDDRDRKIQDLENTLQWAEDIFSKLQDHPIFWKYIIKMVNWEEFSVSEVEEHIANISTNIEAKSEKISNVDTFIDETKKYISDYEIPDWDGDIDGNMTIWGFIQRIDSLSDEERKQAIEYIQSYMISIMDNGNIIWPELFCLLALLYEKIEDKAQAYYCYEEAINSPWVDSEIYRTYYVSMLHFWENSFIQELFIKKWIRKYPANTRPYRYAVSLYYEYDNNKCIEILRKLKELDDWIYGWMWLEDMEKELLELTWK